MTDLCAVDVAVDKSRRLGPLSYLVPDDLGPLSPGDGVTVPFGRSVRTGVVLGPSADPSRATRPVISRDSSRACPSDMAVFSAAASRHFSDASGICERLLPAEAFTVEPLDAGEVVLASGVTAPTFSLDRALRRRLYLRPPLVDPACLAAWEAHRLSSSGQVLIICPTVALVDHVMECFATGAARLDSRARNGALRGFREGSVSVGVGTRASAWFSAARLGGIVVVEEGHAGLVESRTPYTSALEVASERAAASRAAFSVVSGCPSASGLGAKLKVVPVGTRADWPAVTVLDRSSLAPTERLLPPKLVAAITAASRAGLPVVALAESRPARRLCSQCRAARSCASCDEVECRHRLAPCACGSTSAFASGFDARRLTRLLGVPAATPAQLEALPAADRLVVVLDADRLLDAPGMDPDWTSMRVLLTAAAAAGAAGRVLLASAQPRHPVLASFSSRDAQAFAQRTWATARRLGLPPFGNLVHVRTRHPLRVASWPGSVMGPRRRDGENEVLVQVSDAELTQLRPTLERLQARGRTRIRLS